ncbi:hypothetical protein FHS78_001734 [Parvibaculum indicum]|uniref:class I SAM-dependent methyltransferase n=1 Tax=Parvibaculum indicum TaxID=562969 RepID=UPI00141E67E5|nr:class I SAM-dependent methyltransferase [Parvibaculum indicum]NIJ41447.1 hypothetical protein [Parvibaculum indicum]
MKTTEIPASHPGATETFDEQKSLEQLFSEHKGRVSDKWASYFEFYEESLARFRNRHVRILEIGVQNGGSLELWAQYFPNAKCIVGCDVDPKCGQLTFADDRISVVVGDAATSDTETKILSGYGEFDIIIDDGSHKSSDVIRAFARYFPHLSEGGIYIAEDLHCSYWRGYEGELAGPYTSMAFFKRLCDVVNHEHWEIGDKRSDILRGIADRYAISFDEDALSYIHSIKFLNSICLIEKKAQENNVLGVRRVAGRIADVDRDPLALDGTVREGASGVESKVCLPEENAERLAQILEEKEALLAELANERDALLAEKQLQAERLEERSSELAALTKMLWEKELSITKMVRKNARLLKIALVLLGPLSARGRLRALLPVGIYSTRRMRKLRRKKLFDSRAYFVANPDLTNAGVDPLQHYLQSGFEEGRKVGLDD